MIERNCKSCGNVFSVHPSRVAHGRGLHCSPACQYKTTSGPRSAVKRTCEGCGTGFLISPSTLKRKGGGKFCTRICRDKHWRGDKTPNWQNGGGVYKRGPNWFSTRRKILERDKHECTCCGATGPLDVHHVIPFRMFVNSEAANSPDNLVSLCKPCHRRADARFKWVSVAGGAIQMNAGGYAWELAKQRGLA